MIGVLELLYDIDLKLNKIATSAHQHINVEDKILALNEAQLALIKRKVSAAHPASGLDSSTSRYDDLECLVVPHVLMNCERDLSPGPVAYRTDLKALAQPYMYFIDCYLLCTKGRCKERTVKGFRIKHADLQPVLANKNTCPSFEYQETPIMVSANYLYAYTDGSFAIDSCHLSYIRYPGKIDIAGYIDFDGNPSITRNSELPAYLKDELVDIAVQQLAMSTENAPAAQFAQLRAQQQS